MESCQISVSYRLAATESVTPDTFQIYFTAELFFSHRITAVTGLKEAISSIDPFIIATVNSTVTYVSVGIFFLTVLIETLIYVHIPLTKQPVAGIMKFLKF